MPRSTFPLASNGEGILGVALTRLSDGSRLAVSKPIRARRHWETLGWTGDELAQMRGEKFTLDVYDYRASDWGWAATDAFVRPRGLDPDRSVTPVGGSSEGGTLIEIVGQNFGASADGIVVFIGNQECTSLGMTQSGSLSCITPPKEPGTTGIGVTVSVVVGDYDRVLQLGPFGGHQAGHCGDGARSRPVLEVHARGGEPRGGRARSADSRTSTRRTGSARRSPRAREDSQYRYTAAAADDDVGDAAAVYAAEILPSFMRFDPAVARSSRGRRCAGT